MARAAGDSQRGVEYLRRIRVDATALARGATSPTSAACVTARRRPGRRASSDARHLAQVGSAMAALWASRGLPLDEPFLVPISVDRRRKASPGRSFGNYLSFTFARFVPSGAAPTRCGRDPSGLAEAVRTDGHRNHLGRDGLRALLGRPLDAASRGRR
jgi:hypothetical protein